MDNKKTTDELNNEYIEKQKYLNMDRRTFMKIAGATAGVLTLGRLDLFQNIPVASARAPVNLKKFVDPLISVIPKLIPDTTTYPGKDYYEIFMQEGKFQFSSKLPVTSIPNTTWGYGSNYNQGGANVFLGYLGPTIEATMGKPVVIKYINNLPTATNPLQASIDPTVPDPAMYPGLMPGRATPHLHGGFTAPDYDGHPHSWFTSDGLHGSKYATLAGTPPALSNEAIFEYTNAQPASNLWYHDHAMGITRLNVYAGLAGFYFIRDSFDTGISSPSNPFPSGIYEIPLVIQDKQFNPDGSLLYPTVGITAVHPIWVPEFFGDTAVVNGKAFPFLNVEPRRYRFRILNGSQARFYNLWLAGPGKGNLPLWVIGMEQSLLSNAAVPLQKLLLAPGERADVIVDFTGFRPGTTFIMSNDANTPYPGGGRRAGAKIPDIMQINIVTPAAGSPPDTTTLPANLVLPTIAPLSATPGAPMREIVMKETFDPLSGMPTEVKLNELWFADPVEETPASGSTEIWQFINLTVDAHPMHLHLVKFQVLNRQAFNSVLYSADYLAWVAAGRNPSTKPVLSNYLTGLPLPPAPEESGWKDTVKAYPGQITRVIMTFDLPAGTATPAEYVYHCHILEHEENEMMRPMQVV